MTLEDNLVDSNLIAGQNILITGVLRQNMLVGFGYTFYQKQNTVVDEVTLHQMKQFAANNPLQKLQELIAPHLHGLSDIKLAIACQ